MSCDHLKDLVHTLHTMVCFPKTNCKLLVSGTVITETDLAPLSIGSSGIESVPCFRYLWSFVESHGEGALGP